MKKELNPNTLLIAGAIGLVFLGGKKLLELIGLGRSATDKEKEFQMDQLQNENYFDPNYYKQNPSALILTVASANNLAQRIYNAKGIFNDDESAVYGVFEAFQTKSQVSFLSYIFYSIYKKSLFGFLSEFLNVDELSKIAVICNKLPKFQK
tara:strand:- start:4104 stop:4556 length:453 start_codon:yes stop_codon:yes gene_type:complete